MEKPNIDDLLSAEDSNQSVIALDEYLGELSNYGEQMERLSEPQWRFYINQNLEREVNNGGFEQFFFNSSGDFAHETVESLRAIGAEHTAALVSEAISEFPESSVPKATATRRALMLELWPDSANSKCAQLDDLFFEYQDNLNSLNLAFVAAHRSEF